MPNAKMTRFIQLFPLILLVTVALAQIVQVNTINLTPWKGGGFGMFASNDGPQARFLRIYLSTGDEDVPVAAPQHLNRLIDQVRYMPNDRTLSNLSDALVQQVWVSERYAREISIPHTNAPEDSQKAVPDSTAGYRALLPEEPVPPPEQRLAFRGVRVELWRQTFDTQQVQAHAYKWLEVTRNR